MALKESQLWGIRAGRSGEADTLFLKKDLIAIGWDELGNLSELKADRNIYKQKYTESFPDAKPGAIPVNAGQTFRFVNEIQIDDFVVYPSKIDQQIHLGQVTGPYAYRPNVDSSYPHQRSVKWLKALPRTFFSLGALNEIGSVMTLFLVSNYADEFRSALSGKVPTPIEDAGDTIAPTAASIEDYTRDFILKQLAQELKGHPFANFVAHLMETLGYRTRVSPPGPDGGIDIIAHKDELGFEPPIIKVQVKSTEGSVGDPEVSALYGKVSAGEYGLLVTLGTFTKQALSFARSKNNLRLINGIELVELVLQHYEQFDSRYKGLLPLKRIYVPETIETS